MNDNFCLVLCYADWCGHCRRYYIKKDDGSEVDIDVKHITQLKDGDKLPEVETWQEVREYVDRVLNKCKVTQLEHKQIVPPEKSTEKEADKFYNKNPDFAVKTMNPPNGWPTIMMCKRENEKEKYKRFSIFEGNRTSLADIKKFVEDCISGNVQKSEQSGGGIDYRMKYKKYKQMYSELVHKYNTLKHKTN